MVRDYRGSGNEVYAAQPSQADGRSVVAVRDERLAARGNLLAPLLFLLYYPPENCQGMYFVPFVSEIVADLKVNYFRARVYAGLEVHAWYAGSNLYDAVCKVHMCKVHLVRSIAQQLGQPSSGRAN